METTPSFDSAAPFRVSAPLRWSLAGAYFVLFTTMLLVPRPEWVIEELSGQEKSVWLNVTLEEVISYGIHFAGFGSLVVAMLWALGKAGKVHYWSVAVGLSIYGVAIEFLQLFVPNRSCEFPDMLADAVGCAVAAVAMWLVAHRSP